MKKYAADLHIHTCLSPCSDNDMIPVNIINMARLSGLNILGITDHNSAKNIKAFYEQPLEPNLLIIPGMEISTKEEVHILCYFRDPEGLMDLQEKVYNHLPSIKNDKQVFGDQLVVDFMGRIIDEEDKLLISSTNISLDEIVKYVTSIGGICIPSHIDKPYNSLIYNLGFIPNDLEISAVEISKSCNLVNATKKYPFLEDFTLTRSSDAHTLGEIGENGMFFYLNELTFDEFVLALKNTMGRMVRLKA
ncbi:MAG TPA: PHP domain-containing protein [Thermoanaerobacterales bacterium]|nr:PHP domain-containing protein [Thermoanaerobacterales bacterium]